MSCREHHDLGGREQPTSQKKNVAKLYFSGRGQGGQSLPLPVPRSPASRTFVPLCLPTLALHRVAPVFRLIKGIRNPGLTLNCAKT